MNEKLKELLLVYKALLNIVKNEDINQFFLSGEIQKSIFKIESSLKRNLSKEEISMLMRDLEKEYNTINHPRIGLSDFFIWKDNSSERISANKRLEELKEVLRTIFV